MGGPRLIRMLVEVLQDGVPKVDKDVSGGVTGCGAQGS